MPLGQGVNFTEIILRAVIFFFFFFHALGTKTWPVQQSFQYVFHGRVPRVIITVNKPEVGTFP